MTSCVRVENACFNLLFGTANNTLVKIIIELQIQLTIIKKEKHQTVTCVMSIFCTMMVEEKCKFSNL